MTSELPVGPPDALAQPRFANSSTFARLPRLDEVGSADLVVVGAPFDAGVSYRPGARFGPAAIRAGSKLLRPYNPALDVEPFAVCQVADAGDVAMNPFDIPSALDALSSAATSLSENGARLLCLGGDHTIALALLRAVNRRHGPVALVHFDAHLDTWDTYFGAPFTHGTPFRRAFEEGLLREESSLHIGTRGPLYAPKDLQDDERFGFSIVTSDQVGSLGVDPVVRRIRERIGSAPVYVSVDIDVLDPAHAPGTGTPEAGGLSSREMLNLIRGFMDTNVVGADIVEVSPSYDHAEITSIAASHVGYELLSVMAHAFRKFS
ncbi:MAG: agmatinase [Acidimicrobiales bacterium]